MARNTEVTIHCDYAGCRKQPAKADNDHLVVTVFHNVQVPTGIARVVGGPTRGGDSLDFCSWEHFRMWAKDGEKDAAAAREEALEAHTPTEPAPVDPA